MPATVSTRSLVIAACSTIVEWYDFTLFLYMAAPLTRVFFGGDVRNLKVMFATFAISYLMRPLGAALFGHLGDRFGRRQTMLLSMALMTFAMLAMGLIPTSQSTLRYASTLMLGLRCLMSFSVGGEYNAVVVYMTEGAPQHRRGLVTSMACCASEVGGLLAAGIAATVVHVLSEQQLDSWGWRIPFLLGALLAGLTLLARSAMDESPAFDESRSQDNVPQTGPLRMALATGKLAVLQGFAVSALGSVTYYLGMTYVPSFLAQQHAASENCALWLSTAAALLATLCTPLVGWLTDRIGRRPVLRLLTMLTVVLPVPLFAWMVEGNFVWLAGGVLALAALGGGISAVGAVTTAELFPSAHRLSGLALGVSSATVLFGGLTPYVTQQLLEYYAWPGIPGVLIAVIAVAFLPVMLSIPETRPAQARKATAL